MFNMLRVIGYLLGNSYYLGTEGFESSVDVFVTTVYLFYIVNGRGAFG